MIRVVRPSTGEEELRAIRAVLESGLLTQGKAVARFERRLAEVTGAPHAVAVSSGTAALHVALLGLAVGRGDEVITSAFGFPATANTIELVGACPVLVDIDLATYNLDPGQLEQAITPRTKVIVPVHAFGLMADMAAIARIAGRRGLAVIEDAACALGATQRVGGSVVTAGSAGAVGCFSFHPRKSITTGEGGCLTTADEGLADQFRALRNHGLESVRGGLDVTAPGLNYRLTDIQGAMGAIQVERLDWALAERRRLAVRYNERLAGLNCLQGPGEPEGRRHTYQSYVVLLAADIERERIIAALRAAGIESVRGGYAVHRLRFYRERYGYTPESFPAASMAHDRALVLPLYPGMPGEIVDRVIDCLAAIRL